MRRSMLSKFVDPDARAARRLRVDEPASDREADKPGGIVNIQLPHDPGPVGIGCLDTDSEDYRNVLRCLSFRDELKNLTFA